MGVFEKKWHVRQAAQQAGHSLTVVARLVDKACPAGKHAPNHAPAVQLCCAIIASDADTLEALSGSPEDALEAGAAFCSPALWKVRTDLPSCPWLRSPDCCLPCSKIVLGIVEKG